MTGGSGLIGSDRSFGEVTIDDMLDDCLERHGASPVAGLAVLDGGPRHCRRGSLPMVSSFFSSVVVPEERETSCSCLDSPSLLVDGCDRSIEPPMPRSGPMTSEMCSKFPPTDVLACRLASKCLGLVALVE